MLKSDKEEKIKEKRKSRTTDWTAENEKRDIYPYSRKVVIENLFDFEDPFDLLTPKLNVLKRDREKRKSIF